MTIGMLTPRQSVPALPLVSICIPVWNGRGLAARAVASALSQTYPSIEVVVVDDGSRDGTAEYLRQRFGTQIRLFRHRRNQGEALTTNTAARLSSGQFIKFLHHDDQLREDCVTRMVAVALDRPSVGLVVSRRSLEVADGADQGPEWRRDFGTLQGGMAALAPFASGPSVLEVLISSGLRSNTIGEPSAVMVRRASFEATGGMSRHLRGYADLDLWVRILCRADAAFIDDELVVYTVSSNSTSARNARARRGWLHQLWMAENLLHDVEAQQWRAELLAIRDQERRFACRTALHGALGMSENARAPGEWFGYMGWRATAHTRLRLASLRRRAVLHEDAV